MEDRGGGREGRRRILARPGRLGGWKRPAMGLGVVGAALVGLAFGGVFDGDADPSPVRVGAQQALGAVADGLPTQGSGALIAQLQERARANPGDVEALGLLGLAYQQRARETGDPSWYPKADGVIRQALELSPDDLVATSALASLELTRHRFAAGLVLAQRARDLSPTTARAYGVMGDALIELGRYDEAFAAFDEMVSLKPSASAYARVSYARELLGDVDGAIEAMELAVDSATGAREAQAWALTQLGKLHFGRGDVPGARRAYEQAIALLPGYPFALEALALVAHAEGDDARAVELARSASDAAPLPQFVSLLEDLYDATGQHQLAREQAELIGAIDQLLEANGVETDLEVALYRADHGIDPAETVALARRARAERPSVVGDDVLAWALVRDGECAEARTYAERSLRLGTQDASMLFHRGMVEQCLGEAAAARAWFSRALAVNPHFSVRWAPVARKAIGER